MLATWTAQKKPPWLVRRIDVQLQREFGEWAALLDLCEKATVLAPPAGDSSWMTGSAAPQASTR